MARKSKNTNNIEISESYKKVLAYFFSFPETSIGLNDLSKRINASKTMVKKAVLILVEKGALKKEEIGKAWRIQANQKNAYFTTRKIAYNLQLVYESDIIAEVYKKIPEAKSIILFGSYRWGTDTEKSDIDIAVEVLDSKPPRIETLKLINQIRYRKNIKVNTHVFSRKKIDINLFTNIANGIVLDGLLEVKP